MTSVAACKSGTTLPAEQEKVLTQLRHDIGMFTDSPHYVVKIQLVDSILGMLHPDDSTRRYEYQAMKAAIFSVASKYDSAKKYTNMLDNVISTSDTLQMASFYHGFANGTLYLAENKLDSAFIYANKAYKAGKLDSINNIHNGISLLLSVYATIGDTLNVRRYIREGFIVNPPPSYRTGLKNQLALYYFQVKKYDSSRLIFNEIINDTINVGRSRRAAILENSAYFESMAGNVDQAIARQARAIEEWRDMGNLVDESYANMGEKYGMRGDYHLAMVYFDSAIALGGKRKNFRAIPFYNRDAAAIAARAGDLKTSNVYLIQALRWYRKKDSANLQANIQQAEKRQEIEVKLGVAQKDAQIAEGNAEYANLASIFSIVITVALLLFSAIYIILMGQRFKSRLSQAELMQRLLRLQMEPHFIFNVLSHSIVFVQSGEVEKAKQYISRFARLLQLILVNTRKTYVPIADEIEALKAYIYFQQVNFDNSFEVDIAVYEGHLDDDVLVPPMLIQPFVENAIHHGARKSQNGGAIAIRVEREEHFVHCTVVDNGPGLQTRSGQEEKPSLSTKITLERLEILSKKTGRPARLSVTDRKKEGKNGVCVELHIPVRRPGEIRKRRLFKRAHHHDHT